MANQNWDDLLKRESLEKELLINPADMSALSDLADLLDEKFSDFAGAIAVYEKALEVDPACIWAHNNLALIYKNRLNDTARAKEHYERALAIKPDDSQVLRNFAILMEDDGDYNQSKRLFEQAIEADPFYASAYFSYSHLLYTHLQDYETARKHLITASDITPEDPEIWFRLANLADQHFQDYNSAKYYYEQTIAINPNDNCACNNLANLLDDHFDDLEGAERCYQMAVEIEPDDHIAFFNYALLCRKMKRYDAARAHLETALRLRPDYLKARRSYANLLSIQFSLHEEAITHFEQILRETPEDTESRSDYASALSKNGQYLAARRELERVLAEEPGNAWAHNEMGNLLDDHLGEKAVALYHYQKSLELDPDDAVVNYNIGVLYDRMERFPEARKHFERAIELRPNYSIALCVLANTIRCHFYEYPAAVALFEKAFGLSTNLGNFRCDYAMALIATGNYEQAKKEYIAAISSHPENQVAHSQYADLLYQYFGDHENARVHYGIAAALKGKNQD